ncbi:MAG: hypothetical protein ABIJ26_08460, partial [Candidatus Margulisiibacteriota bacterium]
MDVKQVFRKVLDKYDGKLKKELEALWKIAENEGNLESSLYHILRGNAEAEGLTIAEAAQRWEVFGASEDDEYTGAYFKQVEEDSDFTNSIQGEVNSLSEEEKDALLV